MAENETTPNQTINLTTDGSATLNINVRQGDGARGAAHEDNSGQEPQSEQGSRNSVPGSAGVQGESSNTPGSAGVPTNRRDDDEAEDQGGGFSGGGSFGEPEKPVTHTSGGESGSNAGDDQQRDSARQPVLNDEPGQRDAETGSLNDYTRRYGLTDVELDRTASKIRQREDEAAQTGMIADPKTEFNPNAAIDPDRDAFRISDPRQVVGDDFIQRLDKLDVATKESILHPPAYNIETKTAGGGYGGELFFPPQANPLIQEKLDEFVKTSVAPLNDASLNAPLALIATGGGAPSTDASVTAIKAGGEQLGGHGAAAMQLAYDSLGTGKWEEQLAGRRVALVDYAHATGEQITGTAPAMERAGETAESVANVFAIVRSQGMVQIEETNQALAKALAEHNAQNQEQVAVDKSGNAALNVPGGAGEAIARAVIDQHLNLAPLGEQLASMVGEQAKQSSAATAEMVDTMLTSGSAVDGDLGGISDTEQPEKRTGSNTGAQVNHSGGGGGGGGYSSGRSGGNTGSSGGGFSPTASSSGGGRKGVTMEQADKIAGALENMINTKISGASGGQGVPMGGAMPGLPPMPQFMPFPQPPSPMTNTTGFNGDPLSQWLNTAMGGLPGGVPGNPAGGAPGSGLAGLAGGASGGLEAAGGLAASPHGVVAGGHIAAGGGVGAGVPGAGNNPAQGTTNEPGGGDEKADTEKAAHTVTLQGVDLPVQVNDERLGKMIEYLHEHGTTEHPVELLEAMHEAGIEGDNYGKLLDDPTKATAGDLLISEHGKGVYLGGGDVLMEDGSIKELSEVYQNRPPEFGIFRPELDAPVDDAGESPEPETAPSGDSTPAEPAPPSAEPTPQSSEPTPAPEAAPASEVAPEQAAPQPNGEVQGGSALGDSEAPSETPTPPVDNHGGIGAHIEGEASVTGSVAGGTMSASGSGEATISAGSVPDVPEVPEAPVGGEPEAMPAPQPGASSTADAAPVPPAPAPEEDTEPDEEPEQHNLAASIETTEFEGKAVG